tara:strand:+ start:2483 stop:2653 length:171 start_codon:yes stop_codon:yes gene_type:complete
MSEQIIIAGLTAVLITPIYFMLAHLNNQLTALQHQTTANSIAIGAITAVNELKEKQ